MEMSKTNNMLTERCNKSIIDGAIFIGSEESVFVTRTQEFLNFKGIPVSVIDPYKNLDGLAGTTIFHKIWRSIHRFRKVNQFIKESPKTQTAIVHFLSLDCFWLIPLLANHFDRVVGLAYGSDVLRRVKSRDVLLRIGFKKLDAVAATNDNVLNVLLEDFPFLARRNPQIIKFGLPSFDELLKIEKVTNNQAKTALGFNPEKALICLGYSASPGQRQIELINYFSKNHQKFQNHVFVVPVQYGSKRIAQDVCIKCAEINKSIGEIKFVPLTEFHNPEKVAFMRRATDVLINHSVSDAFSGTVQEIVYAGNLVLSVDHLPYKNMPGFGSAIRQYKTLDEASAQLLPTSLNAWKTRTLAKTAENQTQLHNISSWDAVFPDWLRLIYGVSS